MIYNILYIHIYIYMKKTKIYKCQYCKVIVETKNKICESCNINLSDNYLDNYNTFYSNKIHKI